jgi:site-specific DNA recombinase
MKTNDLRLGLYARVSTDRQAEQRTIASQLEALRQRLVADGGTVQGEREFIDDGYSGSTLLRPALERLRDQAAQGALDRLYVHSPDRLARNFAHQMLLLEELQRSGLEVVFLNHKIGESPEGDLLLQVQGVIAEYERAKIRERGRRGKLHAARTGQVSALASAPYGYRYVAKRAGDGTARYEVVPDAARVVQQMFAWVAQERLSLRAVGRRLEKLGIPSPTGLSRWSSSTMAALLNNPAYQGQAAFGRRQAVPRRPALRPRRGRPQVPRRPCSFVRATTPPILIPVPALVSAELFAAVAEQLAENRRRHRERRAGARQLLQGLIVCGGCGYAFHGGLCRPRRRYYRCGSCRAVGAAVIRCSVGSLRAERVEAAVWQDVCALLRQPHKIEEEYRRRLQDPPGQERRPGAQPSTGMIEKVKRSIARLIDLYSDGLVERTELEPRLQQARQRLRQLEDQAQQEASRLAEQAELRLALTCLQDFAGRVEQGLEHADWQTQRAVIRALVKRVEVTAQEIRIVYRVAPVPFVENPSGGVLQHCPTRLRVLHTHTRMATMPRCHPRTRLVEPCLPGNTRSRRNLLFGRGLRRCISRPPSARPPRLAAVGRKHAGAVRSSVREQ